MAPLSLKIVKDRGSVTRKVKLDSEMKVREAYLIIRDKFHDNIVGNSDYALFLRALDEDVSGVWMEDQRTLGYYMLRDGDVVEYLCKITNLKVRMLDDTVKTMKVDQTKPVSDLMLMICAKIGITNSEEYGLCVMEDENEAEEKEKENKSFTGTLTLKKKSHIKEKPRDEWMEQFSKKLKTDDNVQWVDPYKTLSEAGVDPSRTLLLKRRLFYSDSRVDERDPVQLNLLYVQARDSVLNSQHPVTEEQANDCKMRWIHIRDVHRKIYRKRLAGGSSRPKRAYKYDKHLEFLKMFYKEINVPTNAMEDSGNEEEKSSDNWNEVVLEFNESEDEKPLKKRKKTSKKKKKTFEDDDASSSIVNQSSAAEFDTSDPVDAFLLSIGATLKKFTPYHLNLAKSKIFHIVQEHDLQQIVEKNPTRTEPVEIYFQG